MRTGAEFHGVIAHRNDAHALAVFFAEQSGRAQLLGFFDRHFALGNGKTFQDLFVDLGFDLGKLFGRHGFKV